MFKEEMKMKSFSYTVKDELGLHARPAGMLVKEVKNFQSKVTLERDGKSVDASRLMAVMGMGVKKDQTVTVTVEGNDEDAACEALKAFFKANL
jgi:phosphocarrier protein HPr